MKYSRLIAGVVILFSLFLFMGTTHSEHESEACFDCLNNLSATDWGYVEVWNDTIYHIGVIIFYSENKAETFVIKHDPGMIRRAFVSGRVAVGTYIIQPITEKWVWHKWYWLNVNTGETDVVRVSGGNPF